MHAEQLVFYLQEGKLDVLSQILPVWILKEILSMGGVLRKSHILFAL
jgi:hypothetical protein